MIQALLAALFVLSGLCHGQDIDAAQPVRGSGSFTVIQGTSTPWVEIIIGTTPVSIVLPLPSGTNNIGTVSGSTVTSYQAAGSTYAVSGSSFDIRALTRARDQVSVDTSTVYLGAPEPMWGISPGVRPSTGVTVQEIKDTGRQVVVASATAVAGTTSETIFTLTVSTGFTNGTSGTSFGIPVGKIFRIQTVTCSWRDSGAASAGGSCRLRVQSSGACTVSSPLVQPLGSVTQNAGALTADTQSISTIFPDGLELSGSNTFCMSHVDGQTTALLDVTVVGFQY